MPGQLATELARRPAYRDVLDPETIDNIVKSAPLHDIGKVGIPDRILLKPGPLDPDERREMELHVEKVQSRASVWKFSGKAIVEGKVAAEATFAAMIRDKPAER